MTELLVVLLLLLTVGYSIAHRPVIQSRQKDPNAGELLGPVKRKPDLSRVPTLPPIRRKRGIRDGGQDLRNRRAS
jgi:hypothetical protein